MHDVAALLAEHELLLLFVVIVLGLLLARLQLFGVRLGVAAVLFAGIALSAWLGPEAELHIAPQIRDLGLVLFVYCVGLASGPGFLAAWRRNGVRMSAYALLALAVGAVTALVLGRLLDLGPGHVAGVFAGALTNTPALGAASDRLKGSAAALAPAVAYSVTYPFGVLGAFAVLRLFAKWRQKVLQTERARERDDTERDLTTRNFEITRSDVVGRSIGQLRIRDEIGVVVSRLGRLGESQVPTKYTVLQRGDIVTAVGSVAALDRATQLFGRVSPQHLETRREQVDTRRVLVSRRELVGKKLDELDLDRLFNAQVTRLRRADLDLLPSPQMQLALGDRLRVVAPSSRLGELATFFGDSERALADVDMLALALGITAGLLAAQIPLPGPTGALKLGLAGGPLLIALFLGQRGRTGTLMWSIPHEASLALRELGMLLFLAGVGVSTGAQLRMIELDEAVRLFAVGVVVTLITSCVALAGFVRVGASAIDSLGACSGVQTQPATLAAAHELSGQSERTYVAYALVYPVAMIGKIVLAQLLVLLT